jgi:hypothetical protein
VAVELAHLEEVAAPERGAVRRECIDVVARVRALQQAACTPAGRIQAHHQHIRDLNRRFALHPEEPAAHVEDQVVALVPRHRHPNADPELHRFVDHRGLGDRPLLIRRQH